jgi:hypothetical protein
MFGQKSSHLPTRSRYHCQEISKKHYIPFLNRFTA